MYYKKIYTKKMAILLQKWAKLALQKKLMLFWMDVWRDGGMNQWMDDAWIDVRMNV